jgi:hypothetical protein
MSQKSTLPHNSQSKANPFSLDVTHQSPRKPPPSTGARTKPKENKTRVRQQSQEFSLDDHFDESKLKNKECIREFDPATIQNHLTLLTFDAHTATVMSVLDSFGLNGKLEKIDDVFSRFWELYSTKMEVVEQMKIVAVNQLKSEFAYTQGSKPLGLMVKSLVVKRERHVDNVLTNQVNSAIQIALGRKSVTKTLRDEHTKLAPLIRNYLTVFSYIEFGVRLTSSISLAEMRERVKTTVQSIKLDELIEMIPEKERDENLSILSVIESVIKHGLTGKIGENPVDPKDALNSISFIFGELAHSKWKDKYARAESVPGNVQFLGCDDEEIEGFVENNQTLYIYKSDRRRSSAASIFQCFLLSEISSRKMVASNKRKLLKLGLFFMPVTSFNETTKNLNAEMSLIELFRMAASSSGNETLHGMGKLLVEEAEKGLHAYSNDRMFVRPSWNVKELIEQFVEQTITSS